MARHIAIFLSLLVLSCAARNGRIPGQRQSSASIMISSGSSLLSTSPPLYVGILSYRGADYRVTVDNSATGLGGYTGGGTVYGLNWPEDIAGAYTTEPGGRVWRNQKGVEIDLSPPIQAPGNAGKFEIDYIGPVLPRQP